MMPRGDVQDAERPSLLFPHRAWERGFWQVCDLSQPDAKLLAAESWCGMSVNRTL
jgi:hypothetical protein